MPSCRYTSACFSDTLLSWPEHAESASDVSSWWMVQLLWRPLKPTSTAYQTVSELFHALAVFVVLVWVYTVLRYSAIFRNL